MTPSITERLLGLAKEARTWFRAGAPLVISGEQDLRFSRCLPCEHFSRSDTVKDGVARALGTCDLCGCFMVAKTWLGTAQCPDNPPRWKATMNATTMGFFSDSERQSALLQDLQKWRGTRFFQRAAPAIPGVRADCVSFVEAVLSKAGAIKPIRWPEYVTHYGGKPMLELLLSTMDGIHELQRLPDAADWKSTMLPGDIIVCSDRRSFHHLALYAGDNTVWHSTEKDGVCTGNVHDPLISRNLVTIYRPI